MVSPTANKIAKMALSPATITTTWSGCFLQHLSISTTSFSRIRTRINLLISGCHMTGNRVLPILEGVMIVLLLAVAMRVQPTALAQTTVIIEGAPWTLVVTSHGSLPGYPKWANQVDGNTGLFGFDMDTAGGASMYIERQFPVPPVSPTLSMRVWGNYDPVTVTISVNGQQLDVFTPPPSQKGGTPVNKGYDLSRWAGQTVTIRISQTSGGTTGTFGWYTNIRVTGNPCPDGQYWNGAQCVCPSGQQWNGQRCTAVVCSEGAVNILETCPGGSTWKHRQVCRNNAWVDEYQSPCPTLGTTTTTVIVTWNTITTSTTVHVATSITNGLEPLYLPAAIVVGAAIIGLVIYATRIRRMREATSVAVTKRTEVPGPPAESDATTVERQESQRICKSCGNRNPRYATKYCVNCGAKLGSD